MYQALFSSPLSGGESKKRTGYEATTTAATSTTGMTCPRQGMMVLGITFRLSKWLKDREPVSVPTTLDNRLPVLEPTILGNRS